MISAIDLSSYFVLGAITLLTLNVLIGLLMSVKYNPVRAWPHRYTTYAAAAVFFVHSILTDPTLKDKPVDYFDGEKVYIEFFAGNRAGGEEAFR